MRIFMISIICLALAAPASAGMYKWKDKDGKIYFTDNISQVPADQRPRKHIRKKPSTEKDSNSLSKAVPKSVDAENAISHSPDTGMGKHKASSVVRFTQKEEECDGSE